MSQRTKVLVFEHSVQVGTSGFRSRSTEKNRSVPLFSDTLDQTLPSPNRTNHVNNMAIPALFGRFVASAPRSTRRGFASSAASGSLLPIKMYDLAAGDASVRFSPYCWRITYAAAHKGIPLERVPWNISDKSMLPKPNNKAVPVIIDPNNGDLVEHDSLRIAAYLEKQYPNLPSLFGNKPAASGQFQPNESAERLTHFVATWVERALIPPLGMMLVADIWNRIGDSDKEVCLNESR